MKNLAKSLAYFLSGFITAATIWNVLGTAYTVAFFVAVGAIVFTTKEAE